MRANHMKYLLKTVLRPTLFFPLAIVLLAVVGYLLFNQAIGYSYLSPEHLDDIMLTKLWSMFWLFASALAVYLSRNKSFAPALAVLALSIYFVILYGLLFRGTEYGMNGHWGDNGNRMAEICKMMAYNTFFTDWYLKDLPSFYPPMWFAIMAVYAKLLSIEAYQTIKFGYLFIFLVYPWLLYHFWRKLVSPTAAAAVVVATLFFGYKYIDWIYYEHITAALFIPWWLYYFEGVRHGGNVASRDWKYYSASSLIGGMLFMTYYYWFFIAIAAFPITIIARFVSTRSFKEVINDIRHKAIVTAGVVIVSAAYWFPLLRKIYWLGTESSQNAWFHLGHSNLTGLWPQPTLEVVFIITGIAFAAYLWDYFGKSKLLYFFLGGLILILIDRYLNLSETSIQTRKILEFAHVFTAAPLAIGIVAVWPEIRRNISLARAIAATLILAGLITANAHTEIYRTPFYRISIGQRVPENDLDVFRSVTTRQTVFLTNKYLESCYLPYYLFIPANNMTSHTAGRYSQRELFLDGAITVTEPKLLAYILKHNRYSPVDYVYLPLSESSGKFEQKLYQVSFNKPTPTAKTLLYAVNPEDAPNIFIKRHERGLFELSPPARSSEMDEMIRERYADIYWHLEPIDWE